MRDDAAPPGVPCDARLLRRHALVRVAPAHRPSIVASIGDGALRRAVAPWLATGAPLVVRRQDSDFATAPLANGGRDGSAATIAVGLPLPPALGKLRLALALPWTAVAAIAPPPRLTDTVPALPVAWRRKVAQLGAEAEALGVTLRVFGSAAWQALTGLAYLTAQSDIDLLWRPTDATQLERGIALLHAWQRDCGIALDGEILFGDDAAVAWREWDCAARGKRESDPGRSADDTTRVLVKTLRGPRLVAPGVLLRQLMHRDTHVDRMACA